MDGDLLGLGAAAFFLTNERLYDTVSNHGDPHEYLGATKNRPTERVFRCAELLMGAP